MIANLIEAAIIVAVLMIFVYVNRASSQKRVLNSCQIHDEMPGVKSFRYKGNLYDREKYLSYVMKNYIARNMKKEKVQKLIAKKEAQGPNDEMNHIEIEALKRLLKNYQ